MYTRALLLTKIYQLISDEDIAISIAIIICTRNCVYLTCLFFSSCIWDPVPLLHFILCLYNLQTLVPFICLFQQNSLLGRCSITFSLIENIPNKIFNLNFFLIVVLRANCKCVFCN